MPNELVFTLDAVLHKDLPSKTKIFSIHDMEYYLWVKVSPEIAKHYSLYQIDEVAKEVNLDLSIPDVCFHEPNNMWFKINSMYLNRDAGQHVYRMHFVHDKDEHTISLFFSYIVQKEQVKKPYIYMPSQKKEMVKL